MAERRMISKEITQSDTFLSLPLSSQALYFHLNSDADDDGFVNSPKKIVRMVGATEGDAEALLQKRFLIPFDSGIIVIKHWRINNRIRSDRYKPTTYVEEKSLLFVKPNGAYTLDPTKGVSALVYQTSTDGMHSIGKDRLGKDSKGKRNAKEKTYDASSNPELNRKRLNELLEKRKENQCE